jgi:hypothetical protein
MRRAQFAMNEKKHLKDIPIFRISAAMPVI